MQSLFGEQEKNLTREEIEKLKLEIDEQSDYLKEYQPETTIHIWYGFDWPFYITTANQTPHKIGKKLTLLEYFRRQLKTNFHSEPLLTKPSLKQNQPTEEMKDIMYVLTADLVTLGFRIFSPSGTLYIQNKESNLDYVKRFMPNLLEYPMREYGIMVKQLIEKAINSEQVAERSRESVAKSRGA